MNIDRVMLFAFALGLLTGLAIATLILTIALN